MNIAIISFTVNGYELSLSIAAILKGSEHKIACYTKSKYLESHGGIVVQEPLQQWAGTMFETKDAVIFVGASGIAVRAIAPHVKDKKYDPAILIMDEKGKFCIPLLAGHIGGANELALVLCDTLGSVPVITTATDLNQRFAVDVFAKKNGLLISDMKLAKEVSAKLLHGGNVGFVSELPIKGKLPKGLLENPDDQELGIYVGIHYDRQPFSKTLYLIPRCVALGLGCRKDTPKEKIEGLVKEVCKVNSMFHEALSQVASIDLKKEETGILQYCQQYQFPFTVYTAEELQGIAGEYSKSDFVSFITGVDNVCERSAKAVSNLGTVFQKKIGKNGVTVAFAMEDRSVEFE